MLRQTQILTAAAAVALSMVALPSFADVVNYDFSTVNQQSFGAGAAGSVTVGNATFTQANAGTASYAFTFGPNGGVFSNIDNGGGYVLSSTGNAGSNPTGAPASVTISFASTVYGISFNYGNSDFVYTPNGGDLLTAAINGATVATGVPTYTYGVNGDFYAEGAFSYSSAAGFNSITLTSTDNLGAEDLVLGDLTTASTPVPLPAGIWLLGSGFAVLGFKARRRTA